MKASQVLESQPNQTEPQTQYDRESENLSRNRFRFADNPNPDRFDAIDVGIGLHFSEIVQPKILHYIARVFCSYHTGLLQHVALKVKDPADRCQLIQAFFIAEAVHQHPAPVDGDAREILTRPLGPVITMPGILDLWPATLEDCLIMLALELWKHFDLFAAYALAQQPIVAVEILNALLMGGRYTCKNCAEDERPVVPLLLQQLSLWGDTWAIMQSAPGIKPHALDQALKALPRNIPGIPVATKLRSGCKPFATRAHNVRAAKAVKI